MIQTVNDISHFGIAPSSRPDTPSTLKPPAKRQKGPSITASRVPHPEYDDEAMPDVASVDDGGFDDNGEEEITAKCDAQSDDSGFNEVRRR